MTILTLVKRLPGEIELNRSATTNADKFDEADNKDSVNVPGIYSMNKAF